MKTKKHIVLYVTSSIWDITVCWPIVLLIRLLWGENLRWEKDPSPDSGDGPSLWCDLKPNSWPTRTWYARYESGNWLDFLRGKKPIEAPESMQEVYGKFRTWGGTTLGHGGFYGPGAVRKGRKWSRIQEHEHVHVEQFESAMLLSFVLAVLWFIFVMGFKHFMAAGVVGLLIWWSGYIMMGVSNALTAKLRGEDPYRGSAHEESAYAQDDAWEDGIHG